jgi:hypothetical protein
MRAQLQRAFMVAAGLPIPPPPCTEDEAA